MFSSPRVLPCEAAFVGAGLFVVIQVSREAQSVGRNYSMLLEPNLLICHNRLGFSKVEVSLLLT